jgi:pyruvate dehydrogenase E2 component (dihydrolipoamide acetyltransferase)
MTDFLMPTLGADMTEGKLVEWRKMPGETIQRGEVIAEVETAKGVIEVESFVSGTIEELLAQPGQRAPVGTPLARIRADGETQAQEGPGPVASPAAAPPSISAPAREPATHGGRIAISPLARKRAQELGIDPATVQGTGPGGAVTIDDIERSAALRRPVAAPPVDRVGPMRQVIAAAMSRSKREIPHYYLSATIDLGCALSWMEQENQKRPVTERLLYGVLLVKAVALALREFPELNAVWDADHAVPKEEIHVGVAVSLRQGGLVAPALHNADQQSLDSLMKGFRDLVNRARAGALRSSELSDPTITVTSLGDQGVETVFGIIYPPQVALVGFGKLVERPWIVEGQIVARPLINATLSADHRVTDGHRGARFLAAIDRLLQTPAEL